MSAGHADANAPSVRVPELQHGEYVEVAYAEGEAALDGTTPFPVRVIPADLLRI